MSGQSVNDILQAIAVGFILVVCVVYVVSRFRKKGVKTDCNGCPLADHCGPQKKKECHWDSSGGCGCGCR